MAKIKGIEIKSLKKFKGREWDENYQGNIYLNGKKIGFWSQDSHGGCDIFDFDDKESREKFIKVVKDYYDSNPYKIYYNMTLEEFMAGKEPELQHYDDMYEPHDMFMSELLNLTLDEKLFKTKIKKGYATIVMFNYYHLKGPVPVSSSIFYPSRYTKEMIKTDIEEERKKHPQLKEKVYTDLSDFIVE